MLNKNISALLITGIVLFSMGTAFADDFHYANLLIGDRASGMAGAYTAVSDDATGLYYNPAGVAYSAGRSVSASVNAYYQTEKKYKNVLSGNGWVRTSSALLPNYFGVVQPVGDFKVGLSYAVPESIMEDQDQTFYDLQLNSSIVPFNPPGTKVSSYIINFNNESTAYNFGPSIATELKNNLSAGITLYYYQRRTKLILNQIIKTTSGGSEWTNDYRKVEERGIRPILGFMWSPKEQVSVGLAVSRIFVENSTITLQQAYSRQNLAIDSIASHNNYISLPDGQFTSDKKTQYPYQVSLGVAWFASQSLLVSGDINHFTSVSDRNLKAVDNIALGAEYYFSKNWAMRGGFFTDFANTPNVSSNDVNQNEHIDLYGTTVSISNFTRNTSVTLGGGYSSGSGKAQIIGNSTNVQDAVAQGWMFFLSSSYSY